MTTRLDYVSLIKQILLEHSRIKPAHGDIDMTVSFDDKHANYALLQSGWDGDNLHGAVVHISIIEGKIWIQYDGTEEGVTTELIELGVAKSKIVLGFRHPSDAAVYGVGGGLKSHPPN